ncbi:MAG TPA: Holliday junction branch migration protein RuvA [Vicinamibacterales bacterium]|nr:Holliday junction branch migration protein RuvA [Vicinamibacterales bacterium]
MISVLRGRLLEKHPQRVIVDVHGVGYDVQVPLSTFYNLGEPGADVTLRVHTHVREDAIALFGFLTPLELELFERLIAINGVGPKLALAVLSGIEPHDLVRAVRLQDVARLQTIPGVGRKTAERISLELRDRLPKSLQADATRPRSPQDELQEDVVSALLNLGYQRAAADKVVEQAVSGAASFQDALRRALRALAR